MEAEYRPLETRLSHDTNAVISQLEDHYTAASVSFRDSEPSFNGDVLVFEIESARYATFLAALLIDDPTKDQQDVVYRAFQFAITLNHLAGIPFERLPLREDFGDTESIIELRNRLVDETTDYMGKNEHLNAVTAYFMPEIDPSSLNNHVAKMVVALTSRQMERHQSEQYAANAWADWDGTLSGLTNDFTE